MSPGPPKAIERFVAILIPPACREHVVGDLRERYTTTAYYIAESIVTIPFVVYSRIRRTTDSGVLLLEALALYISLFASAWAFDRPFLYGDYGLLLLSIPAVLTLIALMFIDAYASPGKHSPLKPILDAALAIGIGFLAEALLLTIDREWLLPRWTLVGGMGAGLVIIATLRLLFPPWTEPPKAG